MEKSNLQKLLKEKTQKIHNDAENHPLMKTMADSSYKKEHLLRLFVNLRAVYDVVEQRLLQSYILKNSDLKRTTQIDKDIAALSVDFEADKLADLLTPLECTDLWVAWSWAKPKDMLKGEFYTRWLADLYGGRMMAQKLAPYNKHVEWSDPSKAINDIRSILDEPNALISDEDIVEEAVKVFDYHMELFTAIQNA